MRHLTTSEKCHVVAILLMLFYFTVDNHVDLYPWNNLVPAGSQVLSTLTAWIPFMLIVCAVVAGSKLGTSLGVAWSILWILLQVRQWWLPYFVGPTFLHADFDWYFDKGYASTLSLLQKAVDRPTPDLQHMVLQLLSIAVVVLGFLCKYEQSMQSSASNRLGE